MNIFDFEIIWNLLFGIGWFNDDYFCEFAKKHCSDGAVAIASSRVLP